MTLHHRAAGPGLAALLAAATPALAQQKTLRIAMTAADVPTTTGMPNNGFEGMRFLGFPVFEGLILWDLSRADRPATLRPGLAESWAQDPVDPKTWVFKLRPGVTFQDGTPHPIATGTGPVTDAALGLFDTSLLRSGGKEGWVVTGPAR
jgi:ABC-type transport system substrate-binding protein